MQPDDVMFACVGEDEPSWRTKAFNLALSIRSFGGSLAKAPVVVNLVGSADSGFVREMEGLEVETRVVTPFGGSVAPANKLRMIELQIDRRVPLLVALDCDILVTGDPSSYLGDRALGARPETRDPLTTEQWRMCYEAFGVPEPARTCRMTSSGEITYPYYNSGVLTVPLGLAPALLERWSDYVRAYDSLCDHAGESAPRRWWSDQIALAGVIASGAVPVHDLPVAANLPTILSIHRHYRTEVRAPFVVHYHHGIDAQGFVRSARTPAANPFIDTFNRRRAENIGLDYPGLARPPLLRRIQRAAADHDWYGGALSTRLRRSSAARALRKRVVG